MSTVKTRDGSDALIIVLDDPAALNDFRSNTLRDSLYAQVETIDPPHVALDLGAIDYLSSSGVAVLVGLKRRVNGRQGKLVLYKVRPVVLDLLRMMKLTQYFEFAETEEDALGVLRSTSSA